MVVQNLNADETHRVIDEAQLSIELPKKRKPRAKAVAGPKIKKPRAKQLPPRLRARWGIFNATLKQVAVFDYDQRLAADQKLADLLADNKGTHFMQIVKE